MDTKPRKTYKFASDDDNSFARNFIKIVFILGGLGCLVLFVIGLARNPQKASAEASKPPLFSKAAPGSSADADALYEQAKTTKDSGDLLKAKALYQQLMTENPHYTKIADAQKELGDLNVQIIMSKLMTPQTIEYEVKSGDTLGKIAKKNNTTVDLLTSSNGLKGHMIRVGQKLRIWNATFSIYVSKSQNVLILKAGEEVFKVYSVATGANNITPVGEFTITSKMEHPTWYKKGAVIQPGDPENALGTRWMGFNLPEYGIHGTIEPELIGKQVSHGCVRMRNEDVEQLFSLVPTGTKVTITD